MKKISSLALILLLFACNLPQRAAAQTRGDWMPDDGFWQVVSNPADKQTVLVQFFAFHSRLIYEERLNALHFDPRKRNICRALNECLRTALSAMSSSNRDKEPLMDQGWVSTRINREK